MGDGKRTGRQQPLGCGAGAADTAARWGGWAGGEGEAPGERKLESLGGRRKQTDH